LLPAAQPFSALMCRMLSDADRDHRDRQSNIAHTSPEDLARRLIYH
jgi:hypothetical protein